jgi:tetratricopeptide (TPR) repeat protein
MVLRYWGVDDAQAVDFAALVRKESHGIEARELAEALNARGVIARKIAAEPADASRELASGRPLIALIDGGGGRLHFVVIVSWASGRVLYHDPAAGPFRLAREADFLQSWKATNGLALVVTPGASRPVPPPEPLATARPTNCGPLVDHLVDVARGPDPEQAVADLLTASDLCPAEDEALLALAGVRFRQKRWTEAAAFARQATERADSDPEAWRLLGASLFLADAPRPALAAWNRIDEPRIDRVQVVGLARTRADIATAAIGLRPRDPLTLEALRIAERRVEQLPTVGGGRLIYEPTKAGRADVVASLDERRLVEPALILALRLGAELLGKREARVRINSPTGRGEAVEFGGRFRSGRPAARVSLEIPRPGGVPGVVSLIALWDRQTYEGAARTSSQIVETRRRGAVTWSNWWTSSLRVEVGAGAERFDGRGTFASLRGGAERRFFADRAALVVDGAGWTGAGEAKGFAEFGGTAAFRTAVRPRRWTWSARFDARRVTSVAPLALWPSAGTGANRALLLRGSPLVEDGIVTGEAFGRGLLHATVETELRVADRALARLGVAAFADWAKPFDTIVAPGSGNNLFAVGAGLRIRTAGATAFRFDVARRPGQSGVRVSGAVIPPWPR